MAHVRKQMITFFLTTRCDLRCTYCYTYKSGGLSKGHQTLDFHFARRGLDDFFRDNASRHIRFYGIGEPTLEFGLMQQIYQYAQSKAGDALKVELQTNGVFGEDKAEWIARHVNTLWVSCDGPPVIHDLLRPTASGRPTSPTVEKNLRAFSKLTGIQVGVRVTLTPATISRQIEILDYLAEIGIRFINVLPVFAPIDIPNRSSLQWDPTEFASHFLEAHLEAKRRGIWYNTMCIANFDEPTRHACRACTPCPHLTTDGYVSCCDFAQLGPTNCPGPLTQLIYGRYDPQEDLILYDEEKIARVRSRCAENLQGSTCDGCRHIMNCAGGCLGQVVNETGNLMGRCETNCIIVNYLADRIDRNGSLHPAFHS